MRAWQAVAGCQTLNVMTMTHFFKMFFLTFSFSTTTATDTAATTAAALLPLQQQISLPFKFTHLSSLLCFPVLHAILDLCMLVYSKMVDLFHTMKANMMPHRRFDQISLW